MGLQDGLESVEFGGTGKALPVPGGPYTNPEQGMCGCIIIRSPAGKLKHLTLNKEPVW